MPGVAAAEPIDPSNPLTVEVTGSPLGNILTSPLALAPAFDPTITDYVLRCQAGTNVVHLSVSAAIGKINIAELHGANIDIQLDLAENQALVIEAPAALRPKNGQPSEDLHGNGRVQYWIRCLPHDFPQLIVSKSSTPPPGWYLTSNLSSASGSNLYAFVLDNNGTPVWYRKPADSQPINVTPLPDGTIAWWSNYKFEDYNLRTQATRLLSSPDLDLDPHELQVLANGNMVILSHPVKSNVDLTALGLSPSGTIFDCVIEELSPHGDVVWRWVGSDHISPGESLHQPLGTEDIFHCNSIDVDPASGNVLLSARHADAVYLIDKSTGGIIWKLGGNSTSHDLAPILTIAGDPQGSFHGQHDARFQPNGDISLFDNQSWNASLAARGVEYHIDATARTASFVWAYQAPDGRNSGATGSFRRLSGGADNVIGWGIKTHSPLFTEVDAQGRALLSVTFPQGEFSYRVIKVPVTALDHGFLRATAGLPPFVRTTPPRVAFVGPAKGPASGRASVSVTGAGLTGATAVRFGPTDAAAFTVNNDGSITAIAPAGSGVVSVTVTTPGGTSMLGAQSILTPMDSEFEGDIGSWRSAGIAALSLAYAHSGTYSLKLSPSNDGTESVVTGRYAVPARAVVNGSEWVLSPQNPFGVRVFVTFYDANGGLIKIAKGPAVRTASGTWTLVAAAATSPIAAATAALGLEVVSGAESIYVDGASLLGSDQYAYPPPREGVANNEGSGQS